MKQSDPHISDKLINELVAEKIIDKNTDKVKLQLIIRRYLCQAFADGVECEHCAKNKPNYQQPQYKQL